MSLLFDPHLYESLGIELNNSGNLLYVRRWGHWQGPCSDSRHHQMMNSVEATKIITNIVIIRRDKCFPHWWFTKMDTKTRSGRYPEGSINVCQYLPLGWASRRNRVSSWNCRLSWMWHKDFIVKTRMNISVIKTCSAVVTPCLSPAAFSFKTFRLLLYYLQKLLLESDEKLAFHSFFIFVYWNLQIFVKPTDIHIT